MKESEWSVSIRISDMLDVVEPIASQRKLRLFSVACCRDVWSAINPQYGHTLVAVAEQFADGELTESYLSRHDKKWPPPAQFDWFPTGFGGGFSGDRAARSTVVARALFAAHSASYDARHMGDPVNQQPRAHAQAALLRDIFEHPFRPVVFAPEWRTSTAVALADAMYAARDFAAMPVLADALEEAGCDNPDVLAHCRGPGPHVRGCWVVDHVLGKT